LYEVYWWDYKPLRIVTMDLTLNRYLCVNNSTRNTSHFHRCRWEGKVHRCLQTAALYGLYNLWWLAR